VVGFFEELVSERLGVQKFAFAILKAIIIFAKNTTLHVL